MAPTARMGPVLIAFFDYTKWRNIIVLTSTDASSFESGLLLTTQLRAAGIEVLKHEGSLDAGKNLSKGGVGRDAALRDPNFSRSGI